MTQTSDDIENDIKFDPPAFRQRYAEVFDILIAKEWRKSLKKMVDFGCSEFGFFIFVKRVLNLQELLLVDIDEEVMKENLYRLKPLTAEYIKTRNQPFTVKVFEGRVQDPDCQLKETNVVTAIELIEHLYPDALDAFPYNVFEYIKPKLVVVTTPNADFNVLFKNFNKFRHYDHKFEWTREQFQDWATNIVLRFPNYTVSFSGIAPGPPGTEIYGCCSQMALFVKTDSENSSQIECKCLGGHPNPSDESQLMCNCPCNNCISSASFGICTHCTLSKKIISDKSVPNKFYKLIDIIDYPFYIDKRTEEERLSDEFRYKINTHGQVNGRFYNDELGRAEIPLVDLLYGTHEQHLTIQELDKLLQKIGYKTEECFIGQSGVKELCVLYDPLMDETTNSEPSEPESQEGANQCDENEPLPDWDTEENPENLAKKAESPVDWEEFREDTQSGSSNSNWIAQDSGSGQNPTGTSKIIPLKRTQAMDPEPAVPPEHSKTKDTDDPHQMLQIDSTASITTLPKKKDVVVGGAKFDVDRINELDSFSNRNQQYYRYSFRNFANFVRKETRKTDGKRCSRDRDRESVAGPSNVRRRKKLITWSSESENDSPIQDVKSMLDCMVHNLLNKLDVYEPVNRLDKLIEFNTPLDDNDIIQIDDDDEPNETVPVPSVISSSHSKIMQEVIEPRLPFSSTDTTDVSEDTDRIDEESVERASREALYDPNSNPDLLEEFQELVRRTMPQVDPSVEQDNIMLIGVGRLSDDEDGFPNWLLQLDGGIPNDDNVAVEGPHFYCQGDGLGVHPSMMVVENDEEEDADSESSSNDTAEMAEGTSEPEVQSLQADSSHGTTYFTPPSVINEEETQNENRTDENDNEEPNC
ncbi:uncharacterized protein LOC109600661 isoform X3 [Aethina tumida]|uniref:uncharacterized protein LOC109600661 isoform X3 n=1 Tax=Aethina tumida TaxID=116153 RepID=UPI0021481481|nr:uncharacterized protein LOC109600661 isoform X3 [Aethina tumida]